MKSEMEEEGELRRAANDGNLAEIQNLLDDSVNVNATNKHGNTALHLSVFNGYAEIVKQLVGTGALLNVQNTNSQTPLHLALVRRHDDVTKLLISAGAELDITTKHTGMAALHYASREGAANICQLLLDSGADLNVSDNAGKLAEYYAANPETENVFKGCSGSKSRIRSKDTKYQSEAVPMTTSPNISNTHKTKTEKHDSQKLSPDGCTGSSKLSPDGSTGSSKLSPDGSTGSSKLSPDGSSGSSKLSPDGSTGLSKLSPGGSTGSRQPKAELSNSEANDDDKTEQDEDELKKFKYQKSAQQLKTEAIQAFEWSAKFKARQKVSVFDRLLGKK